MFKKAIITMINACVLVTLFTIKSFAEIPTNDIEIEFLTTKYGDGIKYIISGDDNSYFVTNTDGHITVYNLTDDSVIGETEILVLDHASPVLFPISIPNLIEATPDDYESWSNYNLVYSGSTYIPGIASATYSAVVGYVTGLLNAVGGAVAGWITSVAIDVYNHKYGNLYAETYISTNVYCPILTRRYVKAYESGHSNPFKTTSAQVIWNNTPYDYSEPAECRVLAERYW